MIMFLLRVLLFWLALFETIASARRWRGLSWLDWPKGTRVLPLAAIGLLAGLRGGWLRLLGLVLMAVPALLVQIGASSMRNRALNPLVRLRPGEYERSTITRLDIPMSEGYLPALHIVPRHGARRAVCILHGSGCDKTYYAWPMVDMLVESGCAVLLVDLDGHGENPRIQRYPHILDNPRVAVAWLRERYKRVGLIGISLGGCIAARAVAEGTGVDRLAVLEAPPTLQFSRADMWSEGFALARAELLDLFADTTAYHMIKAWTAAPIRAEISTWDLIAQLDLLGSLPKIDCPLLLLYGASDAIVKPVQARQAQAVMPASARFRLLPRASHLTLQLMPGTLSELRAWFADM